LNISAKCHQNRSLQFRAIPFQIWRVFWDTVYVSNRIVVHSGINCRFFVYNLSTRFIQWRWGFKTWTTCHSITRGDTLINGWACRVQRETHWYDEDTDERWVVDKHLKWSGVKWFNTGCTENREVIVRSLSTVGYTSVVASAIHSRQWSN